MQQELNLVVKYAFCLYSDDPEENPRAAVFCTARSLAMLIAQKKYYPDSVVVKCGITHDGRWINEEVME